MNKIELSVVVMTYNQEKYVRKTIQSIIDQLDQHCMELIIADDCSQDCTRGIIEEFARKYRNIRPVYNEINKGVINNYFDALKLCNGNYVMICGGDDYWLPNKVNMQLKHMKQNDIIVSCTGVEIIDDQGNHIEEKRCVKDTIFFDDLIVQNCVCASSVCFSRKVMEKYVSQVNPQAKDWQMEDYPFLLWVSKQTPIKYIDNILVAYRIVPNSITHTNNVDKQIKFQQSATDIRKYFVEEDKYDVIDKLHHDNITQVYFITRNKKGFRKTVLSEKSIKGIIKFVISYIPGFWKIWELKLNKSVKR